MLVWRPIFANKSTTDCTHVGWTELNLDAVPVKSGESCRVDGVLSVAQWFWRL